MKEAVTYFLKFIKAELEAAVKRRAPDIVSYNAALKKMDSFLAPSLKTDFGMLYLKEPKDKSYYEKVKNMEPLHPRHLFKIDKLQKQDGREYFVAYVGDLDETKEYFEALVASKVAGDFEIFSRFTYGYNDEGPDDKHWFHSGGEELDLSVLDQVEETVRLLPPEDDAASMKQYLKE